jgi:L-lactate utilization protein LutB
MNDEKYRIEEEKRLMYFSGFLKQIKENVEKKGGKKYFDKYVDQS